MAYQSECNYELEVVRIAEEKEANAANRGYDSEDDAKTQKVRLQQKKEAEAQLQARWYVSVIQEAQHSISLIRKLEANRELLQIARVII